MACTDLAWRSHKTTNISWLFENHSVKRASIIRPKIKSLLPSILLVHDTLVHFHLIKAFTNFLLDFPTVQNFYIILIEIFRKTMQYYEICFLQKWISQSANVLYRETRLHLNLNLYWISFPNFQLGNRQTEKMYQELWKKADEPM